MSASLEIRSVRSGDADAFAPLFETYPYKAAQRRMQGLECEKLNRFYRAQLGRSLEAGHPHWAAFAEGEAAALGGLVPHAWHGEIYGIPMARIEPWLNVRNPEAGRRILEPMLDEAESRGFRHLSVRLAGEDWPNLHLFESQGFYLIDVSLKYSRPMPVGEQDASPEGNWRLRVAREEDESWMRRLGSRSHAWTHYLNDPNLPKSGTRALFDAWVARCLGGLAHRVYVLEENDEPLGFVIYLRNPRFAEAVGRRPIILDFVILAPEARGGGRGAWLIRESLRREADENFDYCELRTSHHNYGAAACYEKLGFRLCSGDFILHRTL